MKTRHIIAVGLLSALAVGLLAFGISKTKYKPKTLQTNAIEYPTDITIENGRISYDYHIDIKPDIRQELNVYPNWYGNIRINHNENNTQIQFYRLILFSFDYAIDFNLNDVSNYEIDDAYYGYWLQHREGYITYSDKPTILITGNKKIEAITITIEDVYGDYYEEDDYSQNLIKIRFNARWVENNTYHYVSTYGFYFVDTIEDQLENMDFLGDALDYYGEIGITIELNETALTTIYSQGYNTGVAIGYDATALSNPIDFAPMMLNILTMPFTFISQAFDVTLWPGTQYQINIGNFIKAMIAISAILFIIRLFTSGFSIIGNYTTNINKEAKMRSDNRKSKLAWKSQKITEKGAKQANKE